MKFNAHDANTGHANADYANAHYANGGQSMTTRSVSAMTAPRTAGDSRIGYYMLVGAIFTGCLPVTLARSVAPRRRTARPLAGRPFAAALETAQCTAAQVYSLPG